jgi:hypothetical protein
MNTLLEIIGVSCLSIIFVSEIGWRARIKPFTCELCMAWWIGLLLFVPLYGWSGIPFAALSGWLSTTINRYL